jgi:hypothetical protein
VAHAVIAATTLAALPARAAPAQEMIEVRRPRFQPELRVDALVARATALHLGLGGSLPAGRAVRVEIVAAGGGARRDGDTRLSLRGDVVARFLLDPERLARWGLYAGAGGSVRHDEGGRTRALAVVTIGVEGPGGRRLMPFVEVGLGGGARIGAGVRRAMMGRR